MTTIGKNFHIIHLGADFAELDAWYEDVFGTFRFMQNRREMLKRDASLLLIGDLCVEPIAPSFDLEGWEQAPLGRCFRRFGPSWHSIAWYQPTQDDVVALARSLAAGGVRLFDVTGKPLDGDPTGPIFTHPRDTVTQLEFVPPSFTGLFDPRLHGLFSPRWWAAEHPLHLLKTSHATLAVRDRAHATHVYVDLLGGTLLHEERRTLERTDSSFVALGEDLVIELAQPIDATSETAEHLDRFGEGMIRMTFRVADLPAAERHLDAKGVRIESRDDSTMLADPATTHGARFGFTTSAIPNDPRPDWA